MTEKQRNEHLIKCKYVIKKNQFYKMRDIYYRAIFELGNEVYDLFNNCEYNNEFNLIGFKKALLKVHNLEKQYLCVYRDYLNIKNQYNEVINDD